MPAPVELRTQRRRRSGRSFLALSLAALLTLAPAHALEIGRGPGISLQEMEQFRAEGVPEESWPLLLEALGRREQSAAIRLLIKEQQPFPSARLVPLLAHPKLAIRLGALDLLEDAAGETFGFDPWQEDPDAGGNADALAQWKTWAESGPSVTGKAAATLTSETFRVLALEIMTGDRDRAERAMQRLDAHGLAAIAHIEAFLRTQPALEAAPRAHLKAAEYRVAIRQALPKTAAALARDLALGSVEAQTAALGALGEGGPGVLPVILETLASPDPLVRETAMDAAFKAGKQHATQPVLEHLREEKSESVLHAALRGLRDHASEAAHENAIAGFLNHPAENVVISALEALATSRGGDVTGALTGRLRDSRWRVRAAALETTGRRQLTALSGTVAERLKDEDLFVRVSAVAALQQLSAEPKLFIEHFERDHALKAPILRALLSDRKPMPPRVWEVLWEAPPEVILQCLEALEDRNDYDGRRIPYAARFVAHSNPDVAASALRLLASRGRHSALLLDALKSPDDLRRDAVLDALQLPPGFLAGAAPPAAEPDDDQGASASRSVLDRLYSVFSSARETSPANPASGEVHAQPAEMRAVLERFLRDGSPRQRFQAALVLTSQQHDEAARFLLASFDALSSLDRRAIAGALARLEQWTPGAAHELAVRLLRDAADDVRENAIEAWVESKQPERFIGLLDELARPGSLLQADDIYGYQADRIAQDPRARKPIFDWSRAALANDAVAEPVKVLAVVLLGRSGQAREAQIEGLLDSSRPLLRRAAYRALGAGVIEERTEALLRDDAALVRAALPFLASPQNRAWQHWFSDAHSTYDYEDFEERRYSSTPAFGAWAAKGVTGKVKQASAPVAEALEKLVHDPSDLVRFEALFAMLRLGRPIDPAAFAGLIATQPDHASARERLGNFLEQNYQRLGKGYGVLVPLATGIMDENMGKLLRHFELDQEEAFTSFAALARLAPAAGAPVEEAAFVLPAAAVAPVIAESFRAIFFFKPGCRECDRVRDMLSRHSAALRGMQIEERNINDTENAILNEALAARFRLRDTLRQVTPAVFTQAGALVKDDITYPRLGDLLRRTETLTPDLAWAQTRAPEIAAVQQTITQRYEAFSFGVVAAAGLLDGVNPCAFATIIFLLSYLQIARRSPREILAVGAAFISAVFLTYFAIGLGLAQILAQLTALRVAGMAMTYLLAGFAVVVALLSFRDAQLAAQGQHGEMTLQLPGMLKERIRSTIRTGSRSSRFIAAAFGAGVVISLLELACTGQVYLPTILYMLKSGRTGAVGHLLVYNAAFVAPLILVFALAWAGFRSEALVRFQKEHTALVKVLTGLLFLLLAALLLFGSALLPQLAPG